MRILSYDVPQNWNYFLFGDSHIGARLRHAKGWRKMCDMMQKPYDGVSRNIGIDHGDIIEAITVDDPRYSEFDTKEQSILAQIQSAQRALYPIKDKLVCILDGNHPFKLHKFGMITEYVCKELGVTYGDYSAKITFKNKGRAQFKHYATHGSGSINSVADDPNRRLTNMKLSLKRKLSQMGHADAILQSMGHTHKLLTLSPTEQLYLTDDGKTVEQHYTPAGTPYSVFIHPDFRWYVNTGGFLKQYGDEGGSGYAERGMFPPLPLGFCIAKIRDNVIKDIDKIVL